MARSVRCGLIQARCEWSPEKYSLADIRERMIVKHEKLIGEAAKKKTQILCLQELFYGPYFCAEQDTKWYELTEEVPGGCRPNKITISHRMSRLFQFPQILAQTSHSSRRIKDNLRPIQS